MDSANHNIVLVTPVFHDAHRLSVFGPELARALAQSPLSILWVVADDGSGEKEEARVQALVNLFREVHPDTVFHTEGKHLGKGGAIRGAWRRYPEARWLAFADADGAVGAEDILKLIEKAVEAGPGHAVLGSRDVEEGTKVVQGPLRKIIHETFAFLERLILGLRVLDPQCGAKVVDGAAFHDAAPQLKEDGFDFDPELLTALDKRGVTFIETAVNWTEKGGGTVNPFKVALPMLIALFRIRARRAAGHYDPSS